ncbi:hypothetical protein L9F63_021860, partial [Diploptera punctata]
IKIYLSIFIFYTDILRSLIFEVGAFLLKQVKEHLRNVENEEVQKSAVAAHSWSEKHKIERKAKLIKQIEKPKELTREQETALQDDVTKYFLERNPYIKLKIATQQIHTNFDLIKRFVENLYEERRKKKITKKQHNT